MDTPLSVQLQQAWLLAQLSRQSSDSPPPVSKIEPFSPGPWNSPAFHSSLDPASPSLFHDYPQPWPDLASGASFVPNSWGSTDASQGSVASTNGAVVPASWGPSSVSASSNSDGPASGTSSFEDDISIRPSLEYISDMLMDEQMEDRTCMRQECTAYQAIVNGFYEVLGEKSSSLSSCTDRSISPEANESVEDNKWVDEIFVDEPTSGEQAAAWESTSTSTGSSELDARFLLFDSSTGNTSFSQESPAFSGVLQATESRNSGFLPKEASVSAQAYPDSTVSNLSTPTFLPASEFPALHNILYPGDSRVGSRFRPSQTLHSNYSEDEKFRRVKSEGLHHNAGQHRNQMNGIAASGSGGYRRAISENKSDSRRLSLEEVKMSRGIDHVGGKISDRFYGEAKASRAEDVVDSHVTIGNPSDHVASDMNSVECTPFFISDDKLSFVKNEYLKAEKHAKMYGEWTPEDLDKKYCCQKLGAESNGTNAKRTARPDADAVDLRGLLVSCAQAMAGNEIRKANEILQEIRQHSSPTGSGTQRLAHYFAEGLVARLSGTGARLYTAISNNRPSAAKMLKAYRHNLEFCPFVKLSHYFANQSILKAAEGASRLHIVDYGILYGVQWPCLISALANRKGGPPFLRITGIEFPQPGVYPAERVEETGRRLAEYAREYNVPFEYKAIAMQWEDVEPSSLHLRKGEVLAVNCVHRLRHLLDETVVSSSPRSKVLSRMRSMNPDLLVVGVMNAGFNAPFFVTRFREALYHFSTKFDMNDTVVGSDSPDRVMVEREMLGRDILNVVACEGPERVERPETCRQWQARIQRAGFELLPLDLALISKARAVISCYYHKHYGIDGDSKWLMLGWKGRIIEGLSAWKPSPGAPRR